MEITETFYANSREQWRSWLEKNHASAKEIWLIRYRKPTGKPSTTIPGSVEEALCFGWIDSTVKKLDDERFAQRFTPRRKDSIWSVTNIDRVRKLIENGSMTPAGLKAIPGDVMKAVKSGKIERTRRVIPQELEAPPELLKALKADPPALENWNGWAPSHRRRYIYWITQAKRPETKERRMKKTVEIAKEGDPKLV